MRKLTVSLVFARLTAVFGPTVNFLVQYATRPPGSRDLLEVRLRNEPPDPHGAAGPNGIIQVVNVRIAYWNKTGSLIWGPMPLDGMFSSVGNTNFSFDPKALYDTASGHFYVVLIEQDTANQKSYMNVAVSKGPNPASNTPNDWFLYRIDNTRTVGTNAYWGDYPGLGFDKQAVYIRLNMYTFSDVAGDVQIIVLDKGGIAARGTHAELLETSEIYADIYSSQLIDDSVAAPADHGLEMAQAGAGR